MVAEFQEEKCIVADVLNVVTRWTQFFNKLMSTVAEFQEKKCIIADVLNVVTAGLRF